MFGGPKKEDESETEEFHSGDDEDDDDDGEDLEVEAWFKPLKDLLEEVFTKRFAEVRRGSTPLMRTAPWERRRRSTLS